ncbi:hypothetical protein D3C76_1590400 [compost metagenome]
MQSEVGIPVSVLIQADCSFPAFVDGALQTPGVSGSVPLHLIKLLLDLDEVALGMSVNTPIASVRRGGHPVHGEGLLIFIASEALDS